MLTVKTIKADMAVGDSYTAHIINKSGLRVQHRYAYVALYVYGVGSPHYPVPAKQYQHRVPWWLFDDGLIVLP